MSSETSSLIQPNFYFLKGREHSINNSKLDSSAGSNNVKDYNAIGINTTTSTTTAPSSSSTSPSWWNSLFRKSDHAYQLIENTKSKPRKVPIKVEPKVFFANERTFLAWLHMSVTLASISVAIVAFADANEWSQIYGLMLLPVAIAFCAYSLWMYIHRSAMIRRKDPGPYEDKVGPVALALLLGAAITINFAVKLYAYAA